MSEIKDYDKLYKALDDIRTHTLEMLDSFPQYEVTKKLKKDILDCNDSVRLIDLTIEVLNLYLDIMNEHQKLYLKFK